MTRGQSRIARWVRCTAAVGVASILGTADARAAGKPSGAVVWVAESTRKIRPSEPPGSGTTARISAARNEFEAFQIVVTGAASGVTATATDLTGPVAASGSPYVIKDVRLYAEPTITLRRASSSDPESAAGAWPDALVPAVDEIYGEARNAFPFDVRTGQSRAVWVEVLVPGDAPAGHYSGAVTLTTSGRAHRIDVTLTVRNFTLPATASAKSAFSLAWGALPTGFGFSSSDQATFTELRRAFGWFALDHRVTLSHIDDGYSYTNMDVFEANYGDLMEGTSPARLQGAKLTSVEYLGDLTSASSLDRWSQKFSEPGKADWISRLFQYTCDEPPYGCAWADIQARAAAARAAQPEPIRTLVTATLDDAMANGVDGVIDVMTPVVNYIDDKAGQPYPGDQRWKYDTFLSAPPKELWLYQSCMSHDCGGSASWATGWPSYMIDASAVRNRAMQWMLYRFAASGELYWETGYALYALNDAWTSQWAYTGNGDGTLFYPGTPAKIGGSRYIPVASIRLKMIREGMEDFEYLKLLEKCNSNVASLPQAMSFVTSLFPEAYSAGNVTSAMLMQTREDIANAIEQAVAAGRCPP